MTQAQMVQTPLSQGQVSQAQLQVHQQQQLAQSQSNYHPDNISFIDMMRQ